MPISSKKSLNKLGEEISACKKCLDLVQTRKSPVPGRGAPKAKLIIVGYYPSADGAEINVIPFTSDEEGNIIRHVIEETGLSLEDDVFLTYLVKCAPRKYDKKTKNSEVRLSKPLSKHAVNCFNYLTEEISIITPHIIISLGLNTSSMILQRFFSIEKKYGDMSKLHMRLFENPSFKLVPFYSPKSITSGLISESKYIEDFKTLSRLFAVV